MNENPTDFSGIFYFCTIPPSEGTLNKHEQRTHYRGFC